MHILNKKNYKNHASEVEEKNIEQDLLLTKIRERLQVTKKRATKQIQNNLKFTHQKLGFKLKATNFAFSINR